MYFRSGKYNPRLPKPPKGLQGWQYFVITTLLPDEAMMDPVHIRNHPGKPEFSEEDWIAAKSELTRFMLKERRSHLLKKYRSLSLYGILNVGRYSRFYELGPDATELHDFVGSGSVEYDTNRPLELMEDEDTIHRILMDIHDIAWYMDNGKKRE
jgi:hypothetical protein